MKILLIIALVFVGFVGAAKAQVCGTYTTTLIIKSDDNNSVENAVVQLLALEKDETKNKTFVRDENDKSKFSVTFNEGHLIIGKYKIIVSADGFETAEKEVGFPHCKYQMFEFKLKADKAVSQTILSGMVIDQAGAIIPDTKVILTNTEGRKFETSADEDGVYKISVLPGTYSVEAEYPKHQGWEKFKIEKYEIAATKKVVLDITLRINKEFNKTGFPLIGTPVKNNN